MKDFKELQVWHKSHDLVLNIYKATAKFPRDEIYGLSNQLRRAAVSISSNIAEGCGRGSKKELKQFLSISMGSASEVEYQILLARELGYLQLDSFNSLTFKVQEVKKMLSSYIGKIS